MVFGKCGMRNMGLGLGTGLRPGVGLELNSAALFLNLLDSAFCIIGLLKTHNSHTFNLTKKL